MRCNITNAWKVAVLVLGITELSVSASATLRIAELIIIVLGEVGLMGCVLADSIEQNSVPILMGLAGAFGAIASSTLTSTGDTLITGNCGTWPGTSITGFPPGECTGTESSAGTAASDAEAACLTAYNNAKGLVATQALVSSDLGGLTLGPGVYTFPSAAASLSTILTVDGATNPNGQFIFQISTTFSTSVNSSVVLTNGAQACNIYFQVGSSASILGATMLQGNVLAYASISVGAAASNQGTFCALNGAVTLINNALTAQDVCHT